MTQVYVHPGIEDYFVEYDFDQVRRSPADGGPADLRRQLMQDYVGEKLILLRNVKVDYDRDFVRGVHFPQTWRFKKFQSKHVERARPSKDAPAKQEILQEVFCGDEGRYAQFEDEVRRVNADLRSALDELLRHHRVTGTDIIWRHTETRVENLHFDIDQGSAGFESVRLYLNMDEVPRIWHTSHPLSRILPAFYDELDLAATVGQPLERLLQILSLRLFGNWSSRGREQFPHHMALFEPDDVWICDGRTVPHQVIYGRRVASSLYKLDSGALPTWHRSLADTVAEVHEAMRTGGARPSAADLKGYAYPFGPGGPKPSSGLPQQDPRVDWDRVYSDSLAAKLVRL